MVKRKLFSLAIVALFIPLIMLAEPSKNLFEIANDYYNKGDYEKSISLYDSLLSNNIESSEIYYNLGNAWFKLDEIPKAILYYEKAKKIAPNNEDINYNLELANTHIADRIDAVPNFFLKTWWTAIRNCKTEAQWTYINIALFLVFLIFVIMFFISNNRRKLFFILSIIFLTISMVTGYIGFQSYQVKTSHTSAIIFTPTVDIKSAPDDKSNTIFILHQGIKVFLKEKSAKWQKIRIANGSEGWLKIDDYEEI